MVSERRRIEGEERLREKEMDNDRERKRKVDEGDVVSVRGRKEGGE